MALIRKIEIRNFRCLEKFDWLPSAGINCLIGPGDSGKSSILDAIDYCLGARRNLQITDTDFHNLDVTKPITIAVTLGQLGDNLKNVETYGQYLRGFDAKTGNVAEEPESGLETVLTLLMSVEGDLEPKWALSSARAAALGFSRNLGWTDRISIAPTRLGVYSEANLSWRRGSILNRISEERADASAALVAAAREMRSEFGEKAKDQLAEALKIVSETANELGIPIGVEAKAMLDVHSISISGGTISLHDEDGVPLKNLGLGSARLLIAGLQRRASENSSIVLVDELEYGLEPHRIIRLVTALGAKEETAPLQAFITTHSPVAVRELSADQLHILRQREDEHSASCVGVSPDVQGTVRLYPEALLASSILVCEGASEIGLIRGLDQSFSSDGGKAFTAHGVCLVDGGGTNTFKRANTFQSLGYRTAVLRDSDAAITPELETAFRNNGGTLFCWRAGRALEDELFDSLTDTGVTKLLELAITLKEESLIADQIKSASHNKNDLSAIQTALTIDATDDIRALLAVAAKSGNGWFKSISAMETVAREAINPDLAECDADFWSILKAIFDWIAYAHE